MELDCLNLKLKPLEICKKNLSICFLKYDSTFKKNPKNEIDPLWLDSKLADENTQACVRTQNCFNPHCSIQE